MGVYFILANDAKREYVDPEQIGGGNIKRSGMVYGPMAHLFMFLTLRESGWSVLADTSDEYTAAYYEFNNVTKDVVDEYNKGTSYESDHIRYRDDDP